MELSGTTSMNGKHPNTFEETNTRLSGRWLILARAAWIILASFAFVLLVVSLPQLPAFFAQVQQPCMKACENARGQLSPSALQALSKFGISPLMYAIFSGATISFIPALVWMLIGVVLVWRKSDDWMALLVSLLLIFWGVYFATGLGSFLPSTQLWQFSISLLQTLTQALFFLVFCLFPNGRFVPRWAVWLTITGFLIAPFSGFQGLLPSVNWFLSGPFFFLLMAAVLGTQIYRYRRVSTRLQRQQAKWLIYGLSMVFLISILGINMLDRFFPWLTQLGSFAAGFFNTDLWALLFMSIPISIGIAMLRYRLWDIDNIINRTLVYGILTTSVVGIYVLVVGYLGSLFHTASNLLISLLATGLVAVLFQPLRELLQRWVNRLLYGQRDEPYAVISRLGSRLEATLAPDTVLPTIVETVAQALKLPYAAITLQQDHASSVAISYGIAVEPLFHLPLLYQSEQVGELLLAPRAKGESFTSADRRLLNDLARQVGVAAHAVQLTSDLQQSRERLVTTREEERRRLRRDLHDGLGPTLASITLKLDAARNLLTRDPPAADALLVDLKKQTKVAVADIRRLVYELRPPSLDELGLIPALREQAEQYTDNGLNITIDAPEPLPALTAAVEVATYRIVQEAMTNVVRHAQAHTCAIHFALDHGLEVEICDDGRGIPADHRAGVGLTSIRERAAELGGTCQIEPRPAGGGTRLYVRLPLTKVSGREE